MVNGTEYRMYVLLEYSSAEATKILMNRLKQRSNYCLRFLSMVFKELDNKVNEKNESEQKELETIVDTVQQRINGSKG